MCEPTTIMMGVMAVASAATAAVSVKETNKAVKAAANTEAKNAQTEANANQAALDEQAQEQAQATAIKKMDREREGIAERATLNNTYAGTQGNSVNRVFNTSLFNENYDTGMIGYNEDNAQAQINRQKQSVALTANNRIRSANASRKKATSNLGAGIQIANSAISGASSGYSLGRAYSG